MSHPADTGSVNEHSKNPQADDTPNFWQTLVAVLHPDADATGGDAVTVLQRLDRAPINKRFTTAKDGKIQKDGASPAEITDAIAMVVGVPNQQAMVDLLRLVGGDPTSCIIPGTFKELPAGPDRRASMPFYIFSTKRAEALSLPVAGWGEYEGRPATCRKKTNMAASNWLLLDRDILADQPQELVFGTVDEWWEKMKVIFPSLDGVGRIDLPSSSGRLLGADGNRALPMGGSHHYVQLEGDDLDRLRAAAMAQSVLSGVYFMRTWGEHKRPASIFDYATLSHERLSFDGAPVSHVKNTSIAPPDVKIGLIGGRWKSTQVALPERDAATELQQKTGLKVVTSTNTNGARVAALEDNDSLTLGTIVRVDWPGGGEKDLTIADLWLEMIAANAVKVRCQTPFRNSQSWAALVRLTRDGIMLYDVGPHVTYRLALIDRAGPPMGAFIDRLTRCPPDALDARMRWAKAAAGAIGRHEAQGHDMDDERDNLADAMTGLMPQQVAAQRLKKWIADARGAAGASILRDRDGLPMLDEALRDMNDRYGLAMMGAKTVVVEEKRNGLGYWQPFFYLPSELRTFLQNYRAIVIEKGKARAVEVFPVWMRWEQRNTFTDIGFVPEVSFRTETRRLQQGGSYNGWQGYAVEPEDPTNNPEAQEALQVVLDHIWSAFADQDGEKYEYFLDWTAAALQHPSRTNLPALVLKSDEEGVGKGQYMDGLLLPIYGTHGFMASSGKHVTGQFNGHLAWAVMLSINEAIWGGDKERAGAYKSMLTDPVRPVEYKFRDAIPIPNYSKAIISTNEEWFAPVGLTDRRHAVYDCSSYHKGAVGYFKELAAACRKARGAFLYMMLNRKVDADRMREPPKWVSKAAEQSMFRTADSVAGFLHEFLDAGAIKRHDADRLTVGAHQMLELSSDKLTRFLKADVYDAYAAWTKQVRYDKPVTETAFWMRVKKLLNDKVGFERQRSGLGGERQRWVVFPPIADLRAAFQSNVGRSLDWSDD